MAPAKGTQDLKGLGHKRLTASLVQAAENESGEVYAITSWTLAVKLTQPVDSDSALDKTARATEVRVLSVPELAVCLPPLLHKVETCAARGAGF